MPDPNKKASKKQEAAAPREIIYPEVTVELCKGDNAITMERMKDLLGWTELDAKDKSDYHLVDHYGNKIVLTKNDNNRRLDERWARTIGQDHLNRNFKFNGETMIIGKTGTILSAQHRGVGFILACQKWADEADPDARKHWLAKWPEEPVMETVVVFGIEEDEATKRTFDCTKPRTMADVFYSCGLFGKVSKKKEALLAKLMDYAVRLIWDRTGAKNDAYSPYRTNSEAMEFVHRHERIVRAVKAIYDDWKDVIEGNTKDSEGKKLKAPEWMVSFGTAAGLLYLMGASMTDGGAYRAMDEMSEKGIDFSIKPPKSEGSGAVNIWDKACEFWMWVHSSHPGVKAIQRVMTAISSKGGTLSNREKIVVFVKAWNVFCDGKPVTDKAIMPEYKSVEGEEGVEVMSEWPTVGGIDIGGVAPESDDSGVSTEKLPTPEEIAAEKEAIKAEREAKMKKDGEGAKPKKDKAPAATPEVKAPVVPTPKTPPAPKANGTPKPAAAGTPAKQPLKGGTAK